MTTCTIYLGKLLGIFCLVIGIAMALHRGETISTMTALLYSPMLVFLCGIFAFSAGLAIVLAHNVWRGGALPVVVTLIGWLSLAKGLVLLFLPNDAAAGFYLGGLHYAQCFYLYAGIDIALGAYLTVTSFTQKTT